MVAFVESHPGMSGREIRARALSFAKSVYLGKISLVRVQETVRGWVPRFLTEEQSRDLLQLVVLTLKLMGSDS